MAKHQRTRFCSTMHSVNYILFIGFTVSRLRHFTGLREGGGTSWPRQINTLQRQSQLISTKVQTLGALCMRGTANWWAELWVCVSRGLHASSSKSLTQASYTSRYVVWGSRHTPFVVTFCVSYSERADQVKLKQCNDAFSLVITLERSRFRKITILFFRFVYLWSIWYDSRPASFLPVVPE